MELRDDKGLTEAEFLANYRPRDYERPSVTVDMPIFTLREEGGETALYVLLIQRKNHPFIMQWALPGGFVESNESTETAARRELEEETGIKDLFLEQFYTFSTPGRDPRTWIISCAYVALADGNRLAVQAGDDAREAAWFRVKLEKGDARQRKMEGGIETETLWNLELSHGDICLKACLAHLRRSTAEAEWEAWQIRNNEGLAFDHSQIITMAWMHVRNKVVTGNAACHLLPEVFTMEQLEGAYRVFLGKEVAKQRLEMENQGIEAAKLPGMYRKRLKEQEDRWI